MRERQVRLAPELGLAAPAVEREQVDLLQQEQPEHHRDAHRHHDDDEHQDAVRDSWRIHPAIVPNAYRAASPDAAAGTFGSGGWAPRLPSERIAKMKTWRGLPASA